MRLYTFLSVVLASMAIAAPLQQARNELCASVGDMSCAGLVERATAQARNELCASTGDMSCAGLVEKRVALELRARDELRCLTGALGSCAGLEILIKRHEIACAEAGDGDCAGLVKKREECEDGYVDKI